MKHTTATVMVYNQDPASRKVLLLWHRKLNVWMPPGGHIEPEENPLQAAIRETKEETGIDVTPYLPAPHALDDLATALPVPTYLLEEKIMSDSQYHEHIDFVYVTRIPEQVASPMVAESNDVRWLTWHELSDLPLFDNVRELIRLELLGTPLSRITKAQTESTS